MRGSKGLIPILVLVLVMAGALCGCVETPPYSSVLHGQFVSWSFTTESCTGVSVCELEVDVVNSCRQTVVVLHTENVTGSGGLVRTVDWDTRMDDDTLVPEDLYVMRALLNGRVFDSWMVFVHD